MKTFYKYCRIHCQPKPMSIPSQEDSHATFLELGGANRMYPHIKFWHIMTYAQMMELAIFIQNGFPVNFSMGKFTKIVHIYPKSSYDYDLNGNWNIILKIRACGGRITTRGKPVPDERDRIRDYHYIICRNCFHGCTYCGPLINYSNCYKMDHQPLTHSNLQVYYELIEERIKSYVLPPGAIGGGTLNGKRGVLINSFLIPLTREEYAEHYKHYTDINDNLYEPLMAHANRLFDEKIEKGESFGVNDENLTELDKKINALDEKITPLKDLFLGSLARVNLQDEIWTRVQAYLDDPDYGTPISHEERMNLLPYGPFKDNDKVPVLKDGMDEARKKLMRLKDEMLEKKKKREALRPQTINMCGTGNCSGCGCYQSNGKRYDNGFCPDCFPSGYSAVTGDPIAGKREMDLKEALYMLFDKSGNFYNCKQEVFDFIRLHVAAHFPRLNLKIKLTESIRKSFNMNIKCSSYDTITIKDGKTVQTKDEENTKRIIEVFEPHVKGPGEGKPFAKFYVDADYKMWIY